MAAGSDDRSDKIGNHVRVSFVSWAARALFVCGLCLGSAWAAHGESAPPLDDPLIQAQGQAADDAALMDGLLRRGEAYRAAGAIAPAAADLRRCQALARKTFDTAREAAATGALGSLSYASGSLEEAKVLLEDSLRLGANAGRDDLVARSLLNLAVVETTNRLPDQALAHLDQARRLLDPSASHFLVHLEITVARAQLLAGDVDAAFDGLLVAGDSALRLPSDGDRAALLIAVATTLLDLREFEARADSESGTAVYRFLEAAAKQGADLDAQTRATIWGGLARLYASEGRHEEALALAHRAIAAGQLENVPSIGFRWHWLAAQQLRALGRGMEARNAYERAIAEVKTVRYDLVVAPDIYGRSFRETVGPLFTEFADLMLRQAARTHDDVARQTMLRSVRAGLEAFKSAELEEFFRDDCVASFLATTRSVDMIDASTVVIYPIVLPDRLALLASSSSGLESVEVPVGSAELTEAVNALRRGLEKITTRDYLAPSRRLYDWIIRPLHGMLDAAGAKILVFVPDGALRTIPIAALHDGERFLVERYATAVVPGLDLVDPRPIDRGAARLLVGALTEARGGFAGLPSVADEVAGISQVFRSLILRDASFTTTNLSQALTDDPYTIVHFASHGQLGRTADASFLLTHDGPLSLDDLQSLMELRKFGGESIELLVLSACQTAAGDDRAALGLAGMALKAGARSAVASLWFINDASAARFVTAFYERIGDSEVTKSEALRLAQVAMLADRRFRHPGYWAAYLLIGNWL